MPYRLPSTWEGLEAAGYQFRNRTRCTGCGRTIEWWLSPAGRMMPIEFAPEARQRMSHFAICPKADSFRKKQVEARATPKPETKAKKVSEEPKQKQLFRM